jgi:hypothetical protein
MAILRAILASIFLFGYGISRLNTSGDSNLLAAETVQSLRRGQAASDSLLLARYAQPCIISASWNTSPLTSRSCAPQPCTSKTSNVSILNTAEIWTPSMLPTTFNLPPMIGASRTAMINATSTKQYINLTATAPSQRMTDTVNTPPPYASLVIGLGVRPDVAWSHVFFWAAVTEIVLGIL